MGEVIIGIKKLYYGKIGSMGGRLHPSLNRVLFNANPIPKKYEEKIWVRRNCYGYVATYSNNTEWGN
jgi:hypothetical protein